MRKKVTTLRRIVQYTVLILAISIGGATAYVFAVYLDLKKPGVIVLLFHEIIEIEQEWTNKYQHRLVDFEEQLEYLRREGYRTILPSEIIEEATYGSDEKLIMLTFDDGTPGHYNIVYPLLKEKGFGGVFFVIAGNVGKRYSLSENMLLEMSQNGMEIGSHSYSHPFLDELVENEVFEELHSSKKLLENAINGKVISFAPPGGWYTERDVQIVKKAGYKAFFSCEIGVNDISEPPFIYKRIEVLGDMSMNDFERLLLPEKALVYKLEQLIKFAVHRLIGSNQYKMLSEAF